jgi:S1-C subfamily serine protease
MDQRRFLIATAVLFLAVFAGWILGSRYGTGFSPAPESLEPRETSLQHEPVNVRISPEELDAITIYERHNEAVVNINTETLTYNWFLEPVPREGSSGSGSIIDPRGYVLTNDHVVQNANRIFITLADGERLPGTVVGRDPENDLAVLEFDPGSRNLKSIPFGSSRDLRIGQKVLAIGNPFGLDRTLTAGIVSGLGRPLRARNNLVIRDMIQTDASINPGNSGGPLLNMNGEMIGINTMIFSPTGGSVGIGFAVPVETARRVVPDLIEYGLVQRGWIDIVPRQLFPQLVQYAGLPVEQGVLISELLPGGNADQAGLRGGQRAQAVRYGRTVILLGGDIITGIEDTPVATLANLYEALEDKRPGDTITVHFLRNGNKQSVSVTLSQRPDRALWD